MQYFALFHRDVFYFPFVMIIVPNRSFDISLIVICYRLSSPVHGAQLIGEVGRCSGWGCRRSSAAVEVGGHIAVDFNI